MLFSNYITIHVHVIDTNSYIYLQTASHDEQQIQGMIFGNMRLLIKMFKLMLLDDKYWILV